MSAMTRKVRAVFDGYAGPPRAGLFDVAMGLGTPLDEALRWGPPACLSDPGTTVRLATDKGAPAVMVHCRTDLVARFRDVHPQAFRCGGTRTVDFEDGCDRDALALFPTRALTHRRGPRKARA